jgi:acyl-CoA dehydrogenase
MNFEDTPEEAAFRREVRSWIDANAPRHLLGVLSASSFGKFAMELDEFVVHSREWQKRKFDAGWACLHWPSAYGGRDASAIERVIWQQEEEAYALLSGVFALGQGMCAPTLMANATEEQCLKYLPAIASGRDIWCQLFSEPGGGSDLAGARTRAVRDGDEWVIDGQKIWTTGAHYSNFGLLIARTDPAAPKHDGLTMFILDMQTPGVDVRPIRQINGQSDFNEVYFTGARIPDANRIGAVGDGWRIALTTLMNERLTVGTIMPAGFDDMLSFCARFRTADGLAIDNPAVRSRLATWAVRSMGLKHTNARSISALSKGELPGPENSIGKLVLSATLQEIAHAALDLQGHAGVLVSDGEAVDDGCFQAFLLRAPGMRIEGGTDEILRNIIAERVLGLPADIRADKGIPFNRIPTSGREVARAR